MHRAKLDVISKPDSHENPYYMPDNAPAVTGESADVEYLCGDCESVLAELPYRHTLSDIIGKVDEFENQEVDINIIQCPECESYNEFPQKGNTPDSNTPSSPDLEKNLKELLKSSEKVKTDQKFEPERHFIDPDTHLLNSWEDIYELSYEDLLRFPKYLSDTMLKTSPPRVSYDHFVYWGWTAAYVTEHPLSSQEPYEQIVREYLSLIHFMLFKLRNIYSRIFYSRHGISTTISGTEISWEDAWRTIEWGNPSIRHISMLSDRYAATTGFAILDGLICAHSDDLSIKTGNLTNEIQSPWHPTKTTLNGLIDYHSKLQTWRYHAAKPVTEQTLEEINNIHRYDSDTLHANIAGIEDIVSSEEDTTGHFLRVVADQRNDNLHGQQSSRVIGTLITTLCSLLIWDAISPQGFEESRDIVAKKINKQENEAFDDVLSAPAFMPVDRVAHLTDLDVLTPSDPRYPEEFRYFEYD